MSSKTTTIGKAVVQGCQDVATKAQQAVDVLPEAVEVGRPLVTFSDAQALVQERWDRQQGQAAKNKQLKHPPPPPLEQQFPGCRIGGSRQQSAFWMIMEVGGLAGWRCCSSTRCAARRTRAPPPPPKQMQGHARPCSSPHARTRGSTLHLAVPSAACSWAASCAGHSTPPPPSQPSPAALPHALPHAHATARPHQPAPRPTAPAGLLPRREQGGRAAPDLAHEAAPGGRCIPRPRAGPALHHRGGAGGSGGAAPSHAHEPPARPPGHPGRRPAGCECGRVHAAAAGRPLLPRRPGAAAAGRPQPP